jgi:hypothetical protein
VKDTFNNAEVSYMEKTDLIRLLNEIFIPIGFKKKGNYWVINGDVITKMVNLQKSQFSNRFYINYGYIIKSIPLVNEMMHVLNGLGSIDANENARINELLDLENSISDEDRLAELEKLISHKIVSRMQSVNTEEDLLNELKTRPHLNDISLVVKKHFNLQ